MLGKSNIGLKAKAAIVLGLFLMLSLVGISASSYFQSTYVAERKVIELEQSKFELLKHEIEGSLYIYQSILLSLSDMPPVQAILRAQSHDGIDPQSQDTTEIWQERLSVIFSAFLKYHPEFIKIRYIKADGDEWVSVKSKKQGELSLAIRLNELGNIGNAPNLIKTLNLKPGQVYISDVEPVRENGVIVTPRQSSLWLSTPVYSPEGKLEALIAIDLSTDRLFSDIFSGDKVQRHLLDSTGELLSHHAQMQELGVNSGQHVHAEHTETAEQGQNLDHRVHSAHPDMAAQAAELDHLIYHDYKREEITGFQKVYLDKDDKSRYWMIVLHIPEKAVFADISESLNKMLLIGLIIGLISLALVLSFVSKRIVNPVLNLAEAAKKLQAGDLSVRVSEKSVHDEFRILYGTINNFADTQLHATQLLEQEVRLQTERVSSILNNVADGIITINNKGIITTFNPAAERIFGYDREEVIGQNVKILMPEPYRSQHDDYVARRVTTGEKRIVNYARELTGLRKDQSTFPLELAVTGVDIDNEQQFIGITRDITERKHIEQMQREFISTVSHELRTPLTSISGSLGLILGGVAGELPEKVKSLLGIASNNCERLIQLINDILDIEKISAGKMQFDFKTVNIIPLIRQAVEENKGYGEKLSVRFSFSAVSDEEAMVTVDEKRIQQVMSNLLSNAAKYSPTNDQVDIVVERLSDDVRISVHDHGKGIPEEFKPKIFGKFSQADSSDTREKGGTGLGLSISQAIVRSHQGDISFDSEEGCGTTFYVDLPLVKKETLTGITDQPNSYQPLILIVEDDKDVSTLLGMMLSNAGYQFHQAYNYEEAMRHIELYQYDAMTLDLMIPGGSGVSLLRELRDKQSTQQLPVIVVSAKVNEGRLDVAGDAFEMVDWIEKPIKEERLVELIKLRLSQLACRKAKILHVEDDPDISTIVSSLLGDAYQVHSATTLKQAKQLFNEEAYNLILLDIGLPDGSGLDLLDTLQDAKSSVPVVIFSAQDIPKSIESQVMATLVKSKTDNEKLISQIKSSINRKAN